MAGVSQSSAYRSASATGQIEISAVGFSARDLDMTLDRSILIDALVVTSAIGKEPGRLFIDLRSDALDVDALPDLSRSAGVLGDDDLSLSLQAAKLRIGAPGDEGIDGGSLALNLAKSERAPDLQGNSRSPARRARGRGERRHGRVEARGAFCASTPRSSPISPR